MEFKLEDRENLLNLREAVIDAMDTKTVCKCVSTALNAAVEFADTNDNIIASSVTRKRTKKKITKDINVNALTVARLNVYFDDKTNVDEYSDAYINTIVKVLSDYFSRSPFANQGYTAFDELLMNLINRKYTTETAVRSEALSAKINLPQQFFPMVIELQDYPEPNQSETFKSQLSFVLKDALIGKYKKRYVAFIPAKEHHTYYHLLNFDGLNSVLFNFNAYAGLCYRSSLIASTFEFYNFGKALIDLGKAMNNDSRNRIFKFNEYHQILPIHICNSFLETNDLSESLIHLCSPAFLEFYRRDLRTGDNLSVVLNEYFTCNCNTTQTAEKLFVHRNTLINKLKTARELLGDTIDNPSFQFVYRMSYNVIKYIEIYKKGSIADLNKYYGL